MRARIVAVMGLLVATTARAAVPTDTPTGQATPTPPKNVCVVRTSSCAVDDLVATINHEMNRRAQDPACANGVYYRCGDAPDLPGAPVFSVGP